MTKNQIKQRIEQIIENHHGFITADQLYNQLSKVVNPGRTQETIRKYIRELVNDGTALIGSSNRGYYKIRTLQQAQNALDYLNHRIPKLQRRILNITNSWNAQNRNDQI